MELTALRTFRFGERNIRRGETVVMSAAKAKEHIARGLANAPGGKAAPDLKAPRSRKPAGDNKAD